jgi:tetratricopeptide (TPR) repeat protein
MARMVLTVVLSGLLITLVGCHNIDSGASQFHSTAAGQVTIVQGSEADLVEKLTTSRLAYRQYLESLAACYENAGNNMKLQWANTELKALNQMPQYTYILDATVAGPDLKAKDSIELANFVYEDIRKQENLASLLPVRNEDSLRQVLARYNDFIRKYPTSDKIDAAAYHCGDICEYFKDYTIAVLYYQRSYQWNPDTQYCGRLRAAYVMDLLSRRAEALELYKEGLKQKNIPQNYRDYAETRVRELSKSQQQLKD